MSYEFSHPHNAWTQRVAQERAKSQWFYQTLTEEYPRAKRSERWKRLAETMHNPQYSTNFDFLRARSSLGSTQSKGQIVGEFFKELGKYQGKLQSLLERPATSEPLTAMTARPCYTKSSLQPSARSRNTARSHIREIERQLREEQTRRRKVMTNLGVVLRRN